MAENQSNTGEEWRPVVGYEGLYEVSSQGQVRGVPRKYGRGKLLRPSTSRWGYLRVHLRGGRPERHRPVHLLVLAAFVGPCPAGLETRHLDDDKTNNTVSNLVYGTKSENAQDRIRNGHHNQANKTHCKRGHPFSPENTRRERTSGGRYCMTCKREINRARRQRLRSTV